MARRFDLLVRVNQQSAEKLPVEIGDEEWKALTGPVNPRGHGAGVRRRRRHGRRVVESYLGASGF